MNNINFALFKDKIVLVFIFVALFKFIVNTLQIFFTIKYLAFSELRFILKKYQKSSLSYLVFWK